MRAKYLKSDQQINNKHVAHKRDKRIVFVEHYIMEVFMELYNKMRRVLQVQRIKFR